jgi:RNA recognition motif-containing protein
MGSKLFVGGLAWGTTDDGLRDAFAEYGAVREAKVIMDRETGRSRGFGFVTFDADKDASAAMQGLDGSSLDGRNIRVNQAEEKPRR